MVNLWSALVGSRAAYAVCPLDLEFNVENGDITRKHEHETGSDKSYASI